MIPYKDRIIDYTREVEVYRCLNRKGKIFSIRQDGKVVAHTEAIILKDCRFIVNKSGKKRAMESKQRDVHAYVKGMIGDIFDPSTFIIPITYNPFDELGFRTNNQMEVTDSKTFLLINGLCFITRN